MKSVISYETILLAGLFKHHFDARKLDPPAHEKATHLVGKYVQKLIASARLTGPQLQKGIAKRFVRSSFVIGREKNGRNFLGVLSPSKITPISPSVVLSGPGPKPTGSALAPATMATIQQEWEQRFVAQHSTR